MKKIRPAAVLLAATALLGAVLVHAGAASNASTTTTSAAAPAWKLTFSQEFNNAAGARPDSTKWNYDLGGEPTWGNEEWQYYTNRPQNVQMDGKGNLVISARKEKLAGMANCQFGTCDITSGRITTRNKFNQKYGKWEARIKVPAGQGLWPAFWMMGNNDDVVDWPGNGEIDVMEIVGNEPSTTYGTAHGPGYSGENGPGGSKTLASGKFADTYHTFTMEWWPSSITWYLDGVKFKSISKGGLPVGKQWVFDHNFYILLNLAVGGTWPGPPNSATKFPANLLIDYVRVYTWA
ncbi:glycoside hydrolase family 16 protein [Kribbella sp. NPDC056861]|uniref:glycoside hydrolase family 16 protein n=1 Tax=Kribbella sp. NPDC056861 TaxID=3154857 RepID=UPI0034497FE4